jgi:hypothetical protein
VSEFDRTMREVPASLFGFMCRVLERYGLETRSAFRGLALAEVDPSRFGERVDWDELAMFLNRCTEGLDPEAQEAMGELYPIENRYMHFAAQAVRSPRVFYRLLEYVTQAAMPHMTVRSGTLDDGRIQFELSLPEHFVPCPVFFASTAGEFRTLTELFGRGRSHVEADVGPWHGRYRIQLPAADDADTPFEASQTRKDQVLEGLGRLFRWIVSQDVPSGEVDAARLRREQGLSWLEAHVVLQVARGESIARTAANLGLPSDVVQRQVRRLEQKVAGSARPGG